LTPGTPAEQRNGACDFKDCSSQPLIAFLVINLWSPNFSGKGVSFVNPVKELGGVVFLLKQKTL
jgi:hypothetical protein